jgi:rhodanese-related sulfurtransferase
MSNAYKFILAVLLVLAIGLMFLPESSQRESVDPEILFQKIQSTSRYLSPDHVAERMINEDPTIFLIDVRSPDQYADYSLPGAFNIPLDEMALPDWEDYFKQEGIDVILFSNSHLHADQAWIIGSRFGYNNMYVMEGGLNKWFKDIMNPVQPSETASNEEFELYSFRKAAYQHFGGASITESVPDQPMEMPVVKRKKKEVTEGGC